MQKIALLSRIQWWRNLHWNPKIKHDRSVVNAQKADGCKDDLRVLTLVSDSDGGLRNVLSKFTPQ